MASRRLAVNFIIFSAILSIITASFWWIIHYFKKDATVTASPQITVILDPGHGGEDGGAVGEGKVYEKDLNLAISKELSSLLRARGISVVCTREEDILLYDRNVDYKGRKKILDLAARLKISRETENSVFVSIHMNTFSESKYRGLQVYYSPNHQASRRLATEIQSEVRRLLQPSNDRPIKAATSSIYLMNRIETPAVLIECGFLSNPEERALLNKPEYRTTLAQIIANAIAGFVEEYENEGGGGI